MTTDIEENALEGIAIVGMAGRFPGADNIGEFWDNLIQGKETVTTFSDEECRESGVPASLLENSSFVNRGGVLEDIERFDADFFGYSPREAEFMDPQQRIFLECAVSALENAGYCPSAYDGSIGVYAGCGINNYLLKNLIATHPQMESVVTPLTFFGNEKDFLTTRVSYQLNLNGPSIGIQSACSTSLTAIQLACQGLMTYQCDMALSGGVSLQTPRMKGYLYMEGQILSADGYCRAFDKRATGTVFGEGVGIVVLKRLEDAVADRDTIYAVIQGIAVNNDGGGRAGFTAPSVEGQAAVIALAQGIAGVDPDDISYIEAHGTGTPLGDPIEIEGLSQAFRLSTERNGYCAIGSVKPNIGHLDVAAGVASIIKTALAIANRQIPPSIHFSEANPELKLEATPFFVNDRLSEWNPEGKRCIAGVSSFGIGGTNAHAVLTEAPTVDSEISREPFNLLLLSAKTESALERMTANLKAHLAAHPAINLADAAYTLMVGREHHPHRLAVVCESIEQAVGRLDNLDPQATVTRFCSGRKQRVVFMFSGQGAQYPQMARELYDRLPLFRSEVDRCMERLAPILGLDLRDIVFPADEDVLTAGEKLSETWLTQPALFVIEYAYARYLMACGVLPEAMIGHSIGEYVAACIAGVFSLEDALELVAARGRLIQEQERGAMLALPMAEADVRPFLVDGVSIAAVNSPLQCVVSGPPGAIDSFRERLKANPETERINCVSLKTSHAFHSGMMNPAADKLADAIQRYPLASPAIPFVSNVTGTYITDDQATDPNYWANHLTRTVRFSDGLRTLMEEPDRVLLEVGPGTVLTALARQHGSGDRKMPVLSTIRHREQKSSDFAFMLKTLGGLWAAGVGVDWKGFYAAEQRKRIPLPSYPFCGDRFWIDPGKPQAATVKASEKRLKWPAFLPRIRKKHAAKAIDAGGEDVEAVLLQIWCRVLGNESITPNDNFFELGGHSLLAAQVFAQIESTFGKNIPLSSLYQAPTVAQLAELIGGGKRVQWSNIVPIRSTGKRPPLFLVHGAEGNVLLYRSLAEHLGDDQPIYGLQADGLDGSAEIDATFETVAEKYLVQIREVQPSGPYYLGGYCLGGIIAMEIAQQLRSLGEEVKFLGMIEIYNIQSLKWPLQLHIRLLNKYLNLYYHFLNTIKAADANRWAFLKDKAVVQWGRMKVAVRVELQKVMKKVGVDTGQGFHHVRVDEAFDEALERYHLQPYDGRITIFVPNRLPAGFRDEQTYGFGPVAVKGVKRIEIPVYPRGTLVEPYVRILANELRNCLSREGNDEQVISEKNGRGVSNGIQLGGNKSKGQVKE